MPRLTKTQRSLLERAGRLAEEAGFDIALVAGLSLGNEFGQGCWFNKKVRTRRNLQLLRTLVEDALDEVERGLSRADD